ncbi:MAG: helix-turn-helix domain-containing protein [Lachnospiraceae bacterium]
MLTVFGKYLRKIRIDNDEILNDMARKLQVTAAYLSAVENGKREIPEGWIEEVRKSYGLEDEQYVELQEAAIRSKKNIKIKLDNETDRDRDLLIAFARGFRGLNDDEAKTIQDILNNKRGV